MILDEIESLIGDRLTARMMATFGGTYVRFPKRRTAESYGYLVRVVGDEAAARLRARYMGERVYIPNTRAEERELRNEEIAALVRSGMSPAEVARSYRIVRTMSELHIRRICKLVEARKVAA